MPPYEFEFTFVSDFKKKDSLPEVVRTQQAPTTAIVQQLQPAKIFRIFHVTEIGKPQKTLLITYTSTEDTVNPGGEPSESYFQRPYSTETEY